MPLTIQYVPFEEFSNLDSERKIQKLIRIVKQNKLVLMEGTLTSQEEADLIEETMATIDSKFKGVEITSFNPMEKNSRQIQDKLKQTNINFRTHEPILGQPDIFIEPNFCIFIDGCYWHCCEICFDKNKFNDKQRIKIIKDNIITQKLIENNYITLRFWEHEIKASIMECIDKIKDSIKIYK